MCPKYSIQSSKKNFFSFNNTLSVKSSPVGSVGAHMFFYRLGEDEDIAYVYERKLSLDRRQYNGHCGLEGARDIFRQKSIHKNL